MKTQKTILLGLLLALTVTSIPSATASAGFFDWLQSKTQTETIAESSWEYATTLTFDSLFDSVRSEPTEATMPLFTNAGAIYGLGGPSLQPTTPTRSATSKNRTLTLEASGYTSSIYETDSSPFITANGAYVYDGVVATNFLPFGTKIKIPAIYGNKIFTVEDRMNTRYSKHLDIWFPDRDTAIEFGRRNVRIEVLSLR